MLVPLPLGLSPIMTPQTAKYPGVEAVAAAMNNAMARWKTMPGPVERCGASFEEMRHGVYLQTR